jgi:polar amino acid transport system substrate-binding protein
MLKAHTLIAVFLILFSDNVYAEEFQFVDAAFCPFICNPKIDHKEGFIVDILRDALATKNHTLVLTIVPYKRALSMVRSGKAHALPAIYKEDAPDLLVGQSVIAIGDNHFFVRPDSDWRYTSEDSWRDIYIGVIDGYTFNHQKFDDYLAQQKKIKNNKVMFISGEKTYQRLLTLLLTKRIDAILDDNAYLQYETNRFSHENNLKGKALVMRAGNLSKGQHVVAYSPKHRDKAILLMEIIDPFVIDLYKTGEIKKYTAPYGIN